MSQTARLTESLSGVDKLSQRINRIARALDITISDDWECCDCDEKNGKDKEAEGEGI